MTTREGLNMGNDTETVVVDVTGAKLAQDREDLLDLVGDLVDDRECAYGTHGFCQVHLRKSPCPHGEAQAYLAHQGAV
jgi:hypothetical protein